MTTEINDQFAAVAEIADALRKNARVSENDGIVRVRQTHAFVDANGHWTITKQGKLPKLFALADGTSIQEAVEQICQAKAEVICADPRVGLN